MSFEVPPVGPIQQSGATPRVPGGPADVAAEQQIGAPVQVDLGVPGSPPEELRAEMAAAAERVDQLREQGRELHFTTQPDTGRLVVEVRDLEGNVIRTIPPSMVLEVAGGAALDI